MNDHSEARLRRGRQLYIRLMFKRIEIGDVDAVAELALRMQELGFYAATTARYDVVHGILRHHWKQLIADRRPTVGTSEDLRAWGDYVAKWSGGDCTAFWAYFRPAIRDAIKRAEANGRPKLASSPG